MIVPALRQAAAAALAVLVSACSSPTGPQPAELPKLDNEARVRELWSASAGDADRFVFSPALADGSVFAAARDGTVMRLDVSRGRTLWSVNVDIPPRMSARPRDLLRLGDEVARGKRMQKIVGQDVLQHVGIVAAAGKPRAASHHQYDADPSDNP